MDMFHRDRKLCKLFESENRAFNITFTINSKEVIIFVRHSGDWDYQKGNLFLSSYGKTSSCQLSDGKMTVKS